MTFSPLCQVLLQDRLEQKLVLSMPKLPQKYREYEDVSNTDPDIRPFKEFWNFNFHRIVYLQGNLFRIE